MGNIIKNTSMNDLLKLAEMLAKSNMVPAQFKNKAEDVVIAVMWGEEVGLQPIQALQNIAVINGKPSIYGVNMRGTKNGMTIKKKQHIAR